MKRKKDVPVAHYDLVNPLILQAAVSTNPSHLIPAPATHGLWGRRQFYDYLVGQFETPFKSTVCAGQMFQLCFVIYPLQCTIFILSHT